VSLLAPLAQLGVPATPLREEVVRLFDLPPTFNEVEPPAPQEAPATMAAPTAAPTPEAATAAVIGGA
jgi:hypothetical protein